MQMPQQRILVVDDDPAVGALVARIARRTGYDAIVTDDPEDFLTRLGSWKPSLVVIDLVMPTLDGVQILRRLGEQRCSARILLISGLDEKVLEDATKLGEAYGLSMAGIIRKPFRADDLGRFLAKLEDENALSPNRIRNALANGEFRLVYQPKYDLTARRITGLEALMRWTDPARGPIPPSVFIAAAEEFGIINGLTQWMVERAILQQAAWTGAGIGLNIAINVSRADLEQSDFPTIFGNLCREHAVDPGSFTFELTESMAMVDERALATALASLRHAGAKLAIDDFGTGYSSLVQLLTLPFSEIKIDRSFVASCISSRTSAVIVKAVVDLAHNLGLSAVAEGVETAEQVEFLRQVRCDLIQGYFISPPVEAKALPSILGRTD